MRGQYRASHSTRVGRYGSSPCRMTGSGGASACWRSDTVGQYRTPRSTREARRRVGVVPGRWAGGRAQSPSAAARWRLPPYATSVPFTAPPYAAMRSLSTEHRPPIRCHTLPQYRTPPAIRYLSAVPRKPYAMRQKPAPPKRDRRTGHRILRA
eukprot:215010-Rhodomonas_salina.2